MTLLLLIFSIFQPMWFVCKSFQIVANLQKNFPTYLLGKKSPHNWIQAVEILCCSRVNCSENGNGKLNRDHRSLHAYQAIEILIFCTSYRSEVKNTHCFEWKPSNTENINLVRNRKLHIQPSMNEAI